MKVSRKKILELPPVEVKIQLFPDGPYCCNFLAEKDYVPNTWNFCPNCGQPLEIEELRPEIHGDNGTLIFLREFFEQEAKP